MIEKWKDIDGYEGYYQVSNFGEVRTVGHKYQRKGFHKIKLHNNRNGYWLADLHKNNLYKSKAIHRLVAKAFLPNPNNFPEVNHIDGNKANNCVDNLEWVSKSQNKWHACNVLGQRTNRIKDFSTGIVFPSQKSAALYYGVSESLIRSIVKKQIFSKRKKKQEITNHRIEIISEREYIDSLNKSELVDAVNRLEESIQGVVNNSIADGGRIQTMCEQLNEIKQYLDWNDISGEEPTMVENASVAKNVREPITLIDMFNEMGRLYADLWNKMEDIHHDLKTKGGSND